MPIEDYIELPGASLRYWRGWIPAESAAALCQSLQNNLPWQQPHIHIAGKRRQIPRLQVWMGQQGAAMRYSGTTFDPLPWIAEVEALKRGLLAQLGVSFNSVLINLYRDGEDSVGWHADDEKELGNEPMIASLSLGATRKFSLKPKDGSVKPLHIDLYSGDLLVMEKQTQRNWLHCLPKDKNLRAGPSAARINLTFRTIQLN